MSGRTLRQISRDVTAALAAGYAAEMLATADTDPALAIPQDAIRIGQLTVRLRPHEPQDLALIVDSWVSAMLADRTCRHWPAGWRHRYRWHVIPQVLAACPALCAVSAVPGAEQVILGWLCGAPGLLHFAAVKALYRRQGLGRLLLDTACGPEAPRAWTHPTAWGMAHMAERWHLIANPWA